MATSLLASGRIMIPYTVSGKTHKVHCYVRGLTAVGGTFNINSRALDANDLVWTDVAQRLWVDFAAFLPSGSAGGTAQLQKLVGNLWQIQAAVALTGGAAAGTLVPGSQITITLRDRNFKHVKFVLVDVNEVVPQKLANQTAGGTTFDGFLSAMCVGTSNVNDPFNWLVGRGNQYLADAAFVSTTVDINRRAKRARGY